MDGAQPIGVEDPADPRLADFAALRDPARRRQVERDGDFFIAEGELVIRALIRSPYPVRSVLLTPTRHARLQRELTGLRCPVYVAPLAVLRTVTGFDIHRGAVASAARLPLPDPWDLVSTARRIAIVEDLADHENLGGVFRNAAAFGLDGVLLSPHCADPLYRRAVRVSIGHVLRIPFARLSPWPAALRDLAARGWDIVALTPDGTEPVDALAGAPGRIAVLLGTEGPGLSSPARSSASRRVRIPIAAGVDSLNVATAAAIAFHELARPAG